MECHFNYQGPIAPYDDPRCTTCHAGHTKECPTHGKGFALGCAHCATAQGAPCQAHWGLEAALKASESGGEDEASDAAFADMADKVRAVAKAMTAKSGQIRAHFRANIDPSTNTCEYFVSVRTL
jgi:hypothetical protein